MNLSIKKSAIFASLVFATVACCSEQGSAIEQKPIADRVNDRDYPSVYMAWYNINMPDSYPLSTNAERIAACAKHDLMWEEPLSQLGEKVDLVLGLVWDHKYNGLADSFTKESLDKALRNKAELLKLNPNINCLFEIRWRDSPMSFLPDDSDWWKRDANGKIVEGWDGGWEPFYIHNFENEEFQDNVARQAKIAVESGVYDGVMLDWSGHLGIIKKIRAAIGDDKLIIVNIHDNVDNARLYKDYINGAFMELNPPDAKRMPVDYFVENNIAEAYIGSWKSIEDALLYYEANFREPQVNCLECWGNRGDFTRMRAITTMSLTISDGYVLYADPNPLVTPDHYHDWYEYWDFELGRPKAKGVLTSDGYWCREYDGGTVVYNPEGNADIVVTFPETRTRVGTAERGCSFIVGDVDGDIFVVAE